MPKDVKFKPGNYYICVMYEIDDFDDLKGINGGK